MKPKLCNRCGKNARYSEWAYCNSCLRMLRHKMYRDGYLQPVADLYREDDERQADSDVHGIRILQQ